MRWIQGENHPQRIWHPGKMSKVLASQVSCSFPHLRRWVKVFSPRQVKAGEALLRISKRGPGLWVWPAVWAWWWLTAMAMMPEAHRACIHMAPGSQPLDWFRGHCFSGGPHRGPGVSWVTLFSPSSVRSPLSSATLSLRVNQAFTHPLSILRHRQEPHVLLGHPISPSCSPGSPGILELPNVHPSPALFGLIPHALPGFPLPHQLPRGAGQHWGPW